MNKLFLFFIGIPVIITASIQTNMAFPQNSNQNMMMKEWSIMKQMNQPDTMGSMNLEESMIPCMIGMGPLMMGNQTMMAMIPCMIGMGPMNQTGMMGPMNQTGMMGPMMMGPMNQTGMLGMQQGILKK
jgi:hypothetical protein